MIKPVTFQGVSNFKANLYALEVKSRFIDQSKANGYYKNYGSELQAVVVGETIQIGTGAFVVQGRMSEIVTTETVYPNLLDNNVGYICARCETYHPSDEYNTTLVPYTAQTFDEIVLTQEDIYQHEADNTNKVYELPIFSFEIADGKIVNLTKLIEPCGDYEKLKAIADKALETAQNAVSTAKNAVSTANQANQNSSNAVSTAQNAVSTANQAVSSANQAKTSATTANNTADEAKTLAEEAMQTVTQGLGTKVTVGGKVQSTFNADEKINKAGDTMNGKLNIRGGMSVDNSVPRNNDLIYMLGIKPFAEGGDVNYIQKEDITVGNSQKLNGETKNEILQTGFIKASSAGAGQSGYIGIAKLTINHTYTNSATELKIIQRGTRSSVTISIRFMNQNNTDPELQSALYYGNEDLNAFIRKESASTWVIYVGKGEQYDAIEVIDIAKGNTSNIKVDLIDTFLDKKPTGDNVKSITKYLPNKIADSFNNVETTFAYSQDGMSPSSTTWLASWNGYQLRALSKEGLLDLRNGKLYTEKGNELNVYNNTDTKKVLHVNYRGGTEKVKLGNGQSDGGLGDLIANNTWQRIQKRGHHEGTFITTGGVIYPLVKFNKSIYDTGNSAVVTITGTMGGWTGSSVATFTASFANRGGEIIISSSVSANNNDWMDTCQLKIGRDENGSSIIFINCAEYYQFDLYVQNCDDTSIIYDGIEHELLGFPHVSIDGINPDYITYDSTDGLTHAIKYSNGKLDQWGILSPSNATIQLPFSYKNVNSYIATVGANGTGNAIAYAQVSQLDERSIYARTRNAQTVYTDPLMWFTTGWWK